MQDERIIPKSIIQAFQKSMIGQVFRKKKKKPQIISINK